jgi:choline-sulfatase/uncharacterized sulfatase
VDLANTLCALAGLERMETADGNDISHLLRGERGKVRRLAVTEFPWSRSIRKGNYRHVYYPKEMFAEEYPEGFGELYDLEADPWEMNNLFFQHRHADVVRAIREEFADWLITTTRPVTIHPPAKATGDQTSVHYGNAVAADGKCPSDRIRGSSTKNYL